MTIAKLAGALALGVGLACLGGLAEATPGLNEKIVADPSTGVALYGFDPVAYFTDGKAVRGRRDVEAEWNGAAWRFANEANRAVFLSSPETYAPRFGGYDPSAVATGVAVAGHPLIFRIEGKRLYLFSTAQTRDGFGDLASAQKSWPKLEAELTD
ncbi:YHS domain-containing (seleno)protein [Chenggangzhangella methanolivorans]|uniref:YHS domain-containing (seleno)protein n=1 Tax=Chenggangzhangella methanolivorans TaxID=1437009 RepID=UPI0036126371